MTTYGTKELRRKWTNRIYAAFYITMAVLCLFLLGVKAKFNPVMVSGESMSPTFLDGEIVSTQKYEKGRTELHIDDVIVFRDNTGKYLIKRIVGLPGDTVQIIDGYLYRNGIKIEDGFPLMKDRGNTVVASTIEDGSVYVLGDNRNYSTDSRWIGQVPMESINGIVDRKLIRIGAGILRQ